MCIRDRYRDRPGQYPVPAQLTALNRTTPYFRSLPLDFQTPLIKIRATITLFALQPMFPNNRRPFNPRPPLQNGLPSPLPPIRSLPHRSNPYYMWIQYFETSPVYEAHEVDGDASWASTISGHWYDERTHKERTACETNTSELSGFGMLKLDPDEDTALPLFTLDEWAQVPSLGFFYRVSKTLNFCPSQRLSCTSVLHLSLIHI